MFKKENKTTGRSVMTCKLLSALLTLAIVISGIPLALSAEAANTGNATISLDKNVYLPNESIVVSASGITQEMKNADAWVGIYKAGAAHNKWGLYKYLEEGNSQVELKAPEELGSYEMRFYSKNKVYTDETLVVRIPFTVAMQKQGEITLEKSKYQALQSISVTVTGITKEMEQAEAYVSIYKKGAAHSDWGKYAYVKAGDSLVKLDAPNLNGEFEMRLYSINRNYTDESFVMSVPFTLSGAVEETTSQWATATIQKANELGLIPNILKGADLTKPITRREFASVSVKLYEKMSGKTAIAAQINPFKDTQDQEVLKAYNVGITSGTAKDEFSPGVLLNREQAATMLTRVFKKAFVQDWALENDSKFAFSYTMPPKFADDAKISDWAKPSVYFMAAHGIISGVGSNNFAPKATTSAEQATNYASATREQALAISVRMTENLDTSDAKEIMPSAAQPVQPGATDESIAGMWKGYVSYGNVSHSLYIDYVFNKDGTFVNLTHTTYDLSCIVYKGNYTVLGSTLMFTNRSRGEFDYKIAENDYGTRYNKIVNLVKQSENAAFSPAEDSELQYSLTSDSDGQLLTIGSFEYRVVTAP